MSVVASPAGPFVLAEGPEWDPETGRISWVDIDAGLILSAPLDAPGDVATIAVGEQIGCAIPVGGGRYLCGLERRIALVGPSGIVEVTAPLIGDGLRFNDGGIDPHGRFVVGSLNLAGADGAQVLLRLEHDGTITVIDDDVWESNGVDWSPDGRTMYSTDTHIRTIFRRDYPAEGAPGPRSVFARTEHYPDGLCVDAGGDLLVAYYDGARIARFGADGASAGDVLALPGRHVTSIAFAGAGLGTAMITTGVPGNHAGAVTRHPDDGRLYVTRDAGRGRPTTQWRPTGLGRATAAPTR